MQMEKNMNNQDSARVRAWLEQGVLLFDGAAGTALRAQAEEGDAVERLCLTQPQRVSARITAPSSRTKRTAREFSNGF